MAEEPTQLFYDCNIIDKKEFFIEIFPRLIKEHEGKWVLISDEPIIRIFDNMHTAMTYARDYLPDGANLIAPIILSNNNLIISIPV